MELPRAPLPKMAPVRQSLPREHLEDVGAAVREALARGGLAERVRGKPVVLIDDVLTTGATVSECARVLLRAGASSVDVLTLARVPNGGIWRN